MSRPVHCRDPPVTNQPAGLAYDDWEFPLFSAKKKQNSVTSSTYGHRKEGDTCSSGTRLSVGLWWLKYDAHEPAQPQQHPMGWTTVPGTLCQSSCYCFHPFALPVVPPLNAVSVWPSMYFGTEGYSRHYRITNAGFIGELLDLSHAATLRLMITVIDAPWMMMLLRWRSCSWCY